MIALKLVFQSLAGVAAVGSVASGGYYMFNIGEDQYFLVGVSNTNDSPTKDLFTDKPPKTSSLPATHGSSLFLTVDSSDSSGNGVQTGTESSTAETTTPPKQEENTKTQNYTCKNTDKKTEDRQCKLFSIAFDNTNKSIDFSDIKSFISKEGKNSTKITKTIKKLDLTTKHFFILKSPSAFVTKQMVESKKTITLSSVSTEVSDKDKSYATLTLLAQLKEDKVIGKTNIAVVQATAVDTVSENLTIPLTQQKTYSCTLQNSENTELTNCVIQELENYASNTFNFSTKTFSTTQANLTIAKDKHYLINWTTPQKLSSLKNKIHFSLKSTQPVKEGTTSTTETKPTFTELSFISAIFAHPTATSAFTEVIIINK